MKIFKLFLLLFFSFILTQAQIDKKKNVLLLQEILRMNPNSGGATIKFYELTGVFDYNYGGMSQKIKLSDLENINVNKNDAGFSVDIKCLGNEGCITFQKSDTASSLFQTSAIQFVDAALANTFASNLKDLCNHYKEGGAEVSQTLFKNESGNTPILKARTETPAKPIVAKPSKEEDAEELEDKKAAAKEKKEEMKEQRLEKQKAAKEKRTIKSNEEEDNDDNVLKKSNTRKKVANHKEEDNEDETTVSKKSKVKKNSIIEDNDDDQDKPSSGKANDFCAQLLAIVRSGKESQYKSIEGKINNADSKTNESLIKLKGTRKNYLSWYKKQRVFISEIKVGKDYDAVYRDFEDLQTSLDDCLGGKWEMNDLSNNDEYSNAKTEVRDIQFKNDEDNTSPSIHVIFVEGNGNFTLFLRVQ